MDNTTCTGGMHAMALSNASTEESDALLAVHACIDNHRQTNSQSSDLAAYNNSMYSSKDTVIDTANTRKRAVPTVEVHVPHHALKHYWCKKQCPIVLGPTRLLHIPRNLVEEDLDLETVLQHGIDVQLEVDNQLIPGYIQATLAMYRNSTGHKYYRILGFKAISKQYESYLLVCWVAVNRRTVRMCIRGPNSKAVDEKTGLETYGLAGLEAPYDSRKRSRPADCAGNASGFADRIAISDADGKLTVKLAVHDSSGRVIGYASDFVPIEQVATTPTSTSDCQLQQTTSQGTNISHYIYTAANNTAQLSNIFQPLAHSCLQSEVSAYQHARLPATVVLQNSTQGLHTPHMNYLTLYPNMGANSVWPLQQLSHQQPSGAVCQLSSLQKPSMEMQIAPLSVPQSCTAYHV